MPDRSEASANRDLGARIAFREGGSPPPSKPSEPHVGWQFLFAFFCGLTGAAFLVWGLT